MVQIFDQIKYKFLNFYNNLSFDKAHVKTYLIYTGVILAIIGLAFILYFYVISPIVQKVRVERGQREHHENAEKRFKTLYKNHEDIIKKLTERGKYVELGDLYLKGNEQLRILPSPQKAIKAYLQGINKNGEIYGLYRLGKLFQYGIEFNGRYLFPPDTNRANQYFTKILEMSKDQYLREMANAEIEQIKEIDVETTTEDGKQSGYNSMRDSLNRNVQLGGGYAGGGLGYDQLADPEHDTGRGRKIGHEPRPGEVVGPGPEGTLMGDIRNFDIDEEITLTDENKIIDGIKKRPAIISDPQSVHDHTVQLTLKHSLENLENKILENETGIDNNISHQPKALYDAIIGEIQNNIKDVSPETKMNAIKVLNDMVKNNTEIMNLENSITTTGTGPGARNYKEMDILKIVWDRIHAPVNKPIQNNLKENLVKQLADCVEHGNTCCATGRVNRVIGSLEGADREGLVKMHTNWSIREEIANMANKIRNDVLKGLSEDEMKIYNGANPTPAQKEFVDTVNNKIKNGITERCEADYVEAAGGPLLSKETLVEELKPYLDAIE